MKKRLLTILMAFMMIASFMPILDGKVYAEDGYPYSVGAGTYIADQWGFYQCECTSYCAYKLNTANGVYFHNTNSHGTKWGHANHWDDFARSKGISVNNTPAVGAIAYWDSGETGHVAWVSSVNGGNITIQEYNYGFVLINGEYHGDHKYNARTISSSNPTGYIHIKDLGGESTNAKLTVNLSNQQSIAGTSYPISGTLKDAGGYPSLKLYVDYNYVAQTWNNEYGNYAFYLDTTKYTDGAHKIGVKMINEEIGLDYTEWFDIYINNNNPSSSSGNVSYTVTNIKNGSVLSGTNASVEGYVYGGGTYPWMNLYLGPSNMVAETYNNEYGAYRFSFDTTKFANGNYRLGVRLRNQDGYDYTTWFDVVINNQETHSHSLTEVPAKAATISAEGNIRYWVCNGCGKCFSDAAGKTEISKAQTVIPKLTSSPSAQPSSASELAPTLAINAKISKPKVAKGAVTVKWKKLAKKKQKKIGGYQIQIATDPNFANIVKTANAGKKASSKKIKGLAKKATYFVRVRTYKGSEIGAWSGPKSFKTK